MDPQIILSGTIHAVQTKYDLFPGVERMPHYKLLRWIEAVGTHGCIKILSEKPGPQASQTHQTDGPLKEVDTSTGMMRTSTDFSSDTLHVIKDWQEENFLLSPGLQLSPLPAVDLDYSVLSAHPLVYLYEPLITCPPTLVPQLYHKRYVLLSLQLDSIPQLLSQPCGPAI